MAADDGTKQLLTLKQLAAIPGMPLRRGRKTLWHWVVNGVRICGKLRFLPAEKIGHVYFTTRADFDELIADIYTEKAKAKERKKRRKTEARGKA